MQVADDGGSGLGSTSQSDVWGPSCPYLSHAPHLRQISPSGKILLTLAPEVSQVGNAALIERVAVTLPLDHAFGFELADVGPPAIEVQRQCRCADGRGFGGAQWRDGRFGGGRDSWRMPIRRGEILLPDRNRDHEALTYGGGG